MPAYTNDGKSIVLTAKDSAGKNALWVYDVKGKTAKVVPGPEKWELFRARMLGDQVWVEWQREVDDPPDPVTGKPKSHEEYTWKRLDPARNEFLPGPKELEGREWVEAAIPGSHEGRKCLFISSGKPKYDVFSFPELKKQKEVTLNGPMSAGNFWWVDVSVKEEKDREPEVERIDLFNPEAKLVCTVSREEAAKGYGEGTDGPPFYARVSEDGTSLLLAFGSGGTYDFGVYDTGKGRFVWGGKGEDCLLGTPLFKSNEVWTLQQASLDEDDYSLTALVRYRHDDKAAAGPATAEKILTYPITTDTSSSPFAPSPDGSHFLLVVNGEPSRLLFIPIKEGVTDKDVRVVELREAK
jgi:hypothetical protein